MRSLFTEVSLQCSITHCNEYLKYPDICFEFKSYIGPLDHFDRYLPGLPVSTLKRLTHPSWQYNQFNWPELLSIPRQIKFSFQSDDDKKKKNPSQSNKTASEWTSMTYKNACTKQSQAFNRGGIVEGLGLYQQSSDTPTKHNQTVHFSDQRVAHGFKSASRVNMCRGTWEQDYTGLFRLNLFLTSQKLWYIQNCCSCPVLVCGGMKPHC